MDAATIERLVNEAVRSLLEHQPTLFAFTAATRPTEWNIAHHLAGELRSRFSGHDCDIEVRKPDAGGRRPDIIIHERGTHERNLLVVEVKRHVGEVDGELEKIRRHWFNEPFRYAFGAVVVIDEHSPPSIVLIENGTQP